MNARRVRLIDENVYKSKDPLDSSITYIAMVSDDYYTHVQYVIMVQTAHYEDKFAEGRPDVQSVDYELRIYLPTNDLQSSMAKQINMEEFTIYPGADRKSYLEYGRGTLSRWMTLVEEVI